MSKTISTSKNKTVFTCILENTAPGLVTKELTHARSSARRSTHSIKLPPSNAKSFSFFLLPPLQAIFPRPLKASQTNTPNRKCAWVKFLKSVGVRLRGKNSFLVGHAHTKFNSKRANFSKQRCLLLAGWLGLLLFARKNRTKSAFSKFDFF